MMQFVWLYVRAWVWAQLPGWPRFAPALAGWLILALACGLSRHFNQELWPHTPGANWWAGTGLALAGAASGWLVLQGLWRWALAWLSGGSSWRWVLVLLAGPVLGLGLLAGGLVLLLVW